MRRWALSLGVWWACLSLGASAAPAEVLAGARSACATGQMATVTVRGHGAARALAADLQTKSAGMYEKAAAFVGASDCAHIDVDLVSDRHAARVALPAWHLPPWAAGAALPHARHIVLMVHADGHRHDRERVLLHEMSHLATASAAHNQSIPRWFDEGLARRLAGEDTQDDDRVLAQARLTSSLIPLEGLDVAFPGNAEAAAVAYAVSGRALEILQERFGANVMRRLLWRVRHGAEFDTALHDETGLWTYQLSGEVERSIAKWHAWFTLLHGVDFGMGFGSLLLMWGGLLARRRMRRRLAEMPDEAVGDLDVAVVRWTVHSADASLLARFGAGGEPHACTAAGACCGR